MWPVPPASSCAASRPTAESGGSRQPASRRAPCCTSSTTSTGCSSSTGSPVAATCTPERHTSRRGSRTLRAVPFPRKFLNDGEDVVLDLHPHWWYFAKPVATLVLLL